MEERWSPLLPAENPRTAPRDYKVRTRVVRYKGGSWYFAYLPLKQSALIKRRFGSSARGWGSIRVQVRIGKTEWATSLFPASSTKAYLFAIKAAVRKAEDLGHGTAITAHIHVI